MAHFLDINQLAEACSALGLDLSAEEQLLVAAAQIAGKAIARRLGIEIVQDATNEPGFAGLCVGFGPATKGQKVPDEIVDFDKGSNWSQGIDDDEEEVADAAR